MAVAATAEGPPLGVGRRLSFCVRPSAAPHPQTYTLDTREALDSQHSTTSCAAYVHYALCNRTMCPQVPFTDKDAVDVHVVLHRHLLVFRT